MKALVLAVLALSLSAAAQTNYPPPPPGRAPAAPATAAPATDINQLLAQVDQAMSGVNASLSRLRIEKWKTDSPAKTQYQSNAESISRNITSALPEITNAVRTAPAGLSANFRLYRNVSALYDVLASLTEATGAFGPKDDYQELAQQLQQVDALRRQLGDRVSELTAAADTQLARLKAQVQQAQAAPPKKIIIDNEEAPAPKKKKKPAAKPQAAPQQ